MQVSIRVCSYTGPKEEQHEAKWRVGRCSCARIRFAWWWFAPYLCRSSLASTTYTQCQRLPLCAIKQTICAKQTTTPLSVQFPCNAHTLLVHTEPTSTGTSARVAEAAKPIRCSFINPIPIRLQSSLAILLFSFLFAPASLDLLSAN